MSTCEFCSEPMDPSATKCKACGETVRAAALKKTGTGEDLSEVLGWVFKDPGWVMKVVIGTICFFLACPLLLVPICALEGYKLRVIRQQWRHPGATPMPEWEDWGALVMDGLKLVSSLLLISLSLVVGMVVVVGACLGIDVLISGQAGPVTAIGGVLAYCFLIIFSLALQYFLPAIELEVLLTGSPLASFHLGAIWRRVTTRPGDYFVMFIYYFLTNLIAQFTLILCYLPLAWSMYTQGAILGRYLAQQRAKDADLGL